MGRANIRSPEKVKETTDRPGRSGQEGKRKSKRVSCGGREENVGGDVKVVNVVERGCKADLRSLWGVCYLPGSELSRTRPCLPQGA